MYMPHETPRKFLHHFLQATRSDLSQNISYVTGIEDLEAAEDHPFTARTETTIHPQHTERDDNGF